MSSEITTGYAKPTCANRGGLAYLTIINQGDVTFTVTNGLATIGSQTQAGYRVALDINSGFANSVPTASRDNNSSINVQTVMAMLKSSGLATDQYVDKLANGFFTIIATDRNGRNKIYGLNNGMFCTTHNGGSGQAGGDMNGWTLNFTGEEDTVPPHISYFNIRHN